MKFIKPTLLVFLLGAAVPVAHAADFSQSTPFESVHDFVETAKEFKPSAGKGDLADLFVVPERGQPDDPQNGEAVFARSIESCEALWSNASEALVFAKALPPTESTRTVRGVLFLLRRTGDAWRISETRQFTASGKDSEISAELTATAGGGADHLGKKGSPPVITVTQQHGGRGYSYQISASYLFEASKLKRLDLQ